jgi:uncharacterized protein
MMPPSLDAAQVIALLELAPHPEGGWFRETFRDAPGPEGRSRSTAIYYLLERGRRSHWHRVDAVETWCYHAGAPLELRISADDRRRDAVILGADLPAGQRPQAVIPRYGWQSAMSLGAWTLVSCIVAPGFEFAGFEMAAPDWEPL